MISTAKRKDFTQTALDVVRQATGESQDQAQKQKGLRTAAPVKKTAKAPPPKR